MPTPEQARAWMDEQFRRQPTGAAKRQFAVDVAVAIGPKLTDDEWDALTGRLVGRTEAEEAGE